MSASLIIGAGGQDGTLLARLLDKRGDKIIRVYRSRILSTPAENWGSVDISNPTQVLQLVEKIQPSEIYYLPAFHHSAEESGLTSGDPSFFERSHDVHVRGLICFLYAITQASPVTRLFYASSSHVFGSPTVHPQNEFTPLNPENIYAITKTMGMHCCRHFRSELGVFAATGILYNHESYLRPVKFLSQKIIQGVLAFQKDRTRKLVLGDLNAVVDWGCAADYVEAMTLILRHSTPEDFIVATGEPRTVSEFVQIACEIAGVNWRDCVITDARLLKKRRGCLIGDSDKLRRCTGWHPKTSFRDMIQNMLEYAQTNTI